MTKTNAYRQWVSALAAMDNAVMNSKNPFFGSDYADLPAVIEATKPILAEYDLAITQPTGFEGEHFGVFTKVIHESGEVVESAFYPLSMSGKPQDRGSELTYARRYEWSAICGISADQDDDGNGANKNHDNQQRKGQCKKGGSKNKDWKGPMVKDQLWNAYNSYLEDFETCENIDDLKAMKESEDFAAFREQVEEDWPDLLNGWKGPEDQYNTGLVAAYKGRMRELMQLQQNG